MTMWDYLLLLCCVLLTVLVLLAVGYAIWLAWTELIEPIVDKAQNIDAINWRVRYYKLDEERIKYVKMIRNFGITSNEMMDHIYSIDVERREELNESGRIELRIKVEITPED